MRDVSYRLIKHIINTLHVFCRVVEDIYKISSEYLIPIVD